MKELAAETLMLESLTYNMKKKLQLICVTTKPQIRSRVYHLHLISLYAYIFWKILASPLVFCITYRKAHFEGWQGGVYGPYQNSLTLPHCAYITESVWYVRNSLVNLLKASTSTQTPWLHRPSCNALESRMGPQYAFPLKHGVCWMEGVVALGVFIPLRNPLVGDLQLNSLHCTS